MAKTKSAIQYALGGRTKVGQLVERAPVDLGPFDALGRFDPTAVKPGPAGPAPVVGAPAPAPAALADVASEPPPDPRDADYGAAVARLLFNNKNARDAITTTGTTDQQGLDTSLQGIAKARTDSLLSTNHVANDQGLFESGQLGLRRGNVNVAADAQQTAANTDFTNRANARAAALGQLGQIHADASSPLGYSGDGQAALDLGDLYSAAVARRLALNQTTDPGPAATPAPVAAPVIAPPTPTPPPLAAPTVTPAAARLGAGAKVKVTVPRSPLSRPKIPAGLKF